MIPVHSIQLESFVGHLNFAKEKNVQAGKMAMDVMGSQESKTTLHKQKPKYFEQEESRAQKAAEDNDSMNTGDNKHSDVWNSSMKSGAR